MLRRYVYRPKVNAFIRDSHGKVHDVSEDVISGNVTRRVNAVSSASLTLQNRNGEWIGKFKPMDKIAIFLTRTNPTLVFTGYLDTNTLFQLYPKPVTLEASCPIKIIQNTYFDPGLVYMQQFFIKLGWAYDAASGMLTDPSMRLGNWDIKGGIGEVLYAALTEPELGGWDSKTVHVLGLPKNFLQEIGSIMQEINAEDSVDLQKLKRRVANLFSGDDVTQQDPGILKPSTSGEFSTQTVLDAKSVAQFAKKAGFRGESLIKAIAIAWAASQLRPTWLDNSTDPQKGSTNYWPGWEADVLTGIGADITIRNLMIMRSWQLAENSIATFNPLATTLPIGDSYPLTGNSDGVQNYTSQEQGLKATVDSFGSNFVDVVAAFKDNNISAEAVVAIIVSSSWGTKSIPLRPDAPSSPAKADSFGLWQIPKGKTKATEEQLFNPQFNADEAYRISKAGTNWSWSIYGKPDLFNYYLYNAWQAAKLVDNSVANTAPVTVDPFTKTILNTSTATSAPGSGITKFAYPFAPGTGDFIDSYRNPSNRMRKTIEIIVPPGSEIRAVMDGKITTVRDGSNWAIWINKEWYITGISKLSPSNLKTGATVKAGQVIGFTGISPVDIGLDSTKTANTNFDTNPFPILVRAKSSNSTNVSKLLVAGTENQPITTKDVETISKQVSLWTYQLENGGPDNFLLAQTLSGKRALSNDISLFEWIKSFATAGGRNFMSLPNGDFLAFFPDYFGYYKRAPYWNISELELIDLEISISDTDLVTHVFTVGPQLSGTEISIFDRLLSQVASVEEVNAFAKFVNVNSENFSPQEFLERYGARPKLIDIPDVRNPLLLWMSAWMEFLKSWASLYQAQVQLTFMPELFPGGLVKIENQLQMYVEDVTHTFDLQGGFTTSATMIAPSLTESKKSSNLQKKLQDQLGSMVITKPAGGLPKGMK